MKATWQTCFVLFFVLTVWKGQNTDDEEEGDNQDEPHPEVTVRVSIVSENKGRFESVKTSRDKNYLHNTQPASRTAVAALVVARAHYCFYTY